LFLYAAFELALKSIFERTDLSEGQGALALRDAGNFVAGFRVVQDDRYGLVSREIALRFATAALFIGLEAGLSPSEVSKLRALGRAEVGRSGGKTSGVKRQRDAVVWQAYAKEKALVLRKKNPRLTQNDLADRIVSAWAAENFKKPDHRPVVGYLSGLEKEGVLPKRTTSLPK
jgi:hypothetical protein